MSNTKFSPNIPGLKIRTDKGFVDFEGIDCTGVKNVFCVEFTDGTNITSSSLHVFYTTDGREIFTGELEIGTELLGITNKTVSAITDQGAQPTFDIVNTETHTFFVNGLLTHNCQFISSDPLLIDSMVLSVLTKQLNQIKPYGVAGEIVFFKEPQRNSVYLVGMDAATGSGEDYTAIVVFDFPKMEQVAEYRTNKVSSVTAYHVLKKLVRLLERTGSTVYFSVENNGVGEAIISLYEADMDPPAAAEFVSETGQKRKGMTTTGKTKIQGCLSLKEMLERGSLLIKSKVLLAELKHFIRARGSYAAKSSSTDDVIMATIIVIRLLSEISTYDQEAYDKLYAHTAEIDNRELSVTAHNDHTDYGYDDGFVMG